MGERDDRIEALKRAEGSAHSALGGVERKYEDERNAPSGGTDWDAQIGALTSQRNALQEQLARVQGELSELERGRDAERKAALGHDAQVPTQDQQQTAPSDPKRADGSPTQDVSKTQHPAPDAPPPQGSEPNGPVGTESLAQSRNGASRAENGSGQSHDQPAQERDKGFPPFEKSDTAPYGFDPKDVSQEPVNFQKVDPNDGNFLWGQAKSPSSDFKPYSQVLHNGQVASLDATMEEIQRSDAAAQQLKTTLSLDKSASEAFDRAQFESGALKLNQTFAEQDRQREQFGSNTLIDSNQSVVDREMELKRWDTTRDLCRGQAARELDDMRTQLRTEVDAEQQRLEASDQSMLALYEKRVSGQADAQKRLDDYNTMLTENRNQQVEGFKEIKNKEFTLAVEDRADTLQAQHFPEVHQNGPQQYFPPVPALSIDGSGGAPQAGGGVATVTPQQSGPGGGAGGSMAPQQPGPAVGGGGPGMQM